MHFKAHLKLIRKQLQLLFLAQNLWVLRPPKTKQISFWDTLYNIYSVFRSKDQEVNRTTLSFVCQ